VIVDEDQQSLAIGKKGQNVRLASRLCGWEIDIKTRNEFEADSRGKGAPTEGGEAAEGDADGADEEGGASEDEDDRRYEADAQGEQSSIEARAES
jgi:N utilization substance protein A